MKLPLSVSLSFVAFTLLTAFLACGIDAKGTAAPAVPDAGTAATSPSPTTTPTSGTSSGSTPPVSTSTPGCMTERVLSFDGINDFVTVADDPALDLSGSFTIEAWIKPGATVEVKGSELTILSHHDLVANVGWDLLVNNQKLELRVYGTSADSPQTAGNNDAPGYVVTNKWAHVAATYDGTSLRTYYDGAFRDLEVVAPLVRKNYRGPLVLGRASYTAKSLFHGMIDDVRISSSARYVGTTATKPTAPLTKDAQTLALWRFDEASGNSVVNDVGTTFTGSFAGDSAPSRVTSDCIPNR